MNTGIHEIILIIAEFRNSAQRLVYHPSHFMFYTMRDDGKGT